jgi:urea carboxylase-associated protein 2
LPLEPGATTLCFDVVSKDDGTEKSSETSTLEAAREHARRQATEAAHGAGPVVPASDARDLPDGVHGPDVVWEETLGPGGYASRVLRRDTVVRITDIDGDACVQLLAYVAARPTERLNVADTVKVQWQAYLERGSLLLSDMGRVLLTIVDDTSGRHDAFCGGSNRRRNERLYGDGSLGGPAPSSRDLMAVAAAKHGLGRGDVPPALNLFKGVRIADDGRLRFEGAPMPGRFVELRAELDVLVLLTLTPHPLDPRPAYTVTPVRLTAFRRPRPVDDPYRRSTPERLRAFENTDELLRSGR